jgi:multidrug efflux system outer membrane protein
MKKLLAVPTALLLIAGCAPAPALRGPETLVTAPDRYHAELSTNASPLPLEDRWWTTLESRSLNESVEAALAHNLDLAAAAARVEQAAAVARIAGAARKPTVGVGVSGSRRKQNFIGLPIPGSTDEVLSSTSTNLGVSLDTSWEVDLWGRLKAGARAAAADFEAAQADLAGARLSIAGQTVKAWLSWAEAGHQVTLSEETVASYRNSLDIVRNRYEQGLAISLDLRLMSASVATAEALLARRKTQLDATGRQLAVLMGRYPGTTTAPPSDLPPAPDAIPSGLPADLIARRPDLTAAERRLAASGARYDAARRALYPRLTLTASGGTSSQEFADLLDGDFGVWSLVAGLTQPLFQGGRLRAGVDQARAASDQALAQYAGAVLHAYREVEVSLAAEPNLADQESHLGEASRQSTAARLLAEDRYRSGLTAFITVLESQRREVEAKIQWISARRQRLDNRINLYLALGGGYQETLP